MMRSLFSGVTGLRSHQTRMDVIGNNIANVNTVGFKKSAVTFKDLYSETISAAAAASGVGAGTTGGVNPKQIGLGSAVNSISVVHTPGSAQYTGNGMDVAISGDGYFVVETPTGKMYTRSGNFFTDLQGNLVTSDGYYVQTVAPSTEAVPVFSINQINDRSMIAGIIKAQSGGDIQQGNITADLSAAQGQEYRFVFKPDADTWSVKMDINDYTPKKDAGASGIAITGTDAWRAATIESLVKNNLNNNSTAGSMELTYAATATGVDVMVGNVVVASGTITGGASNTSIADGETVTLDFGGVLPALTIENNSGTALDLAGVATNLKEANGGEHPNITVKENGTWQMLDSAGQVVDNVTVSATASTDGGYKGDFKISTTEFGIFYLNLSEQVNNQQALSDALGGSSFSLDITEGLGVEYAPPSGQVQEGRLETLKIDFDLYSSLAIDSTGAVVAQLQQDTQVQMDDGQIVNLAAGDKVVLGYVVLANFNNPTGLEKIGDNLYSVSANSGDPAYGMPGTGNAGSLSPSNLEMSNVDLSEEIVNMIITQRGFQANSRIITTTDTMLEELVNLKR